LAELVPRVEISPSSSLRGARSFPDIDAQIEGSGQQQNQRRRARQQDGQEFSR
jgi:hypothetical protein